MSGQPQQPHVSHGTTTKSSIHFYAGLTLAGTASAILTCLFSLLHLQVFLQAYHLPMGTYSLGSTIFAVINTANDVLGAYVVDSLASLWGGKEKHELVGWSGCLFALCFLTPFFRTTSMGGVSGDEGGGLLHFVTSMSLYDTMFSFNCILLSSIITDHSSMSDQSRITFLAIGKITNLMAPMIFAKLALSKLLEDEDHDNLQPLRKFLLVVVGLVCGMCILAQQLLHWTTTAETTTTTCGCLGGGCRRRNAPPKTKVEEDSLLVEVVDGSVHNDTTKTTTTITKKKVRAPQWKQVVKDFMQHPNFRYWIMMELLLEAQTTFMKSFMKTFVDHLLLEQEGGGGLSRSTCD